MVQRRRPYHDAMNRFITALAAAALTLVCATASRADGPEAGPWRAWLSTPGGELPFGLTLTQSPAGEWAATISNGPERIEVPVVSVEGDSVVLDIDYYDSKIEARVEDAGRSLAGTWSKRRALEEVATMEFRAMAGELPRFWPIRHERGTEIRPLTDLDGDWRVEFAADRIGAVARFAVDDEGRVTATFLTPTGDYRYLDGVFDGNLLRLSCFDGAHAFLFTAEFSGDSVLKGEFFSGAHWHDTWTARRDPTVRLADPWRLTGARPAADLGSLSYLTPDGAPVTLADPRFAGTVRLIELFGTWCPNCTDATAYLKELHERYADKGLSIVGLAFEVTGDPERDAAQVKKYAERFAVPYPLLLAGVSDKKYAASVFPLVSKVNAYPTFVFLDREGRIRSIYTGFSGPATGEDHARMRREFEERIDAFLQE